MSCQRVGNAVVCRSGQHEEVHRESKGERWCFVCRKRREFFYIVTAPIVPDYYGPTPSVRCAACNTDDGDCFPGQYREWDW